MLASLLLIAIFLMTFRWFIPRSVLSVASAIPCILIAGIVAMNFFEPAAQAFARSSGPFGFLGSEADFVFFVTMFAGFLALMLNVSAAFPQQSKLKEGFEIPARVVLSVMASYLIMSIALVASDLSPRLQYILSLRPDSAAFLGFVAPDAQWLRFVETIAEGSMFRPQPSIPMPTDGTERPEIAPATTYLRTLRQRFASFSLSDDANANSVGTTQTSEFSKESSASDPSSNSTAGAAETLTPVRSVEHK